MFRSLGQIIVTALIIGLVLIAGGVGWFLRSSVEDSGGQATSEAAQGTEMSAEMAKATLGSGAALEPFIAVAGVGQAQAKPDIASVSLGVQTQAPVARDAQTENSELMAKVIDAIKAMGIEDEDISTHGLSLRPRYDREGQNVDAYVATNNVSVIVRDLDQVGEVLDAGFDAGANVAGGVQFSIADPDGFSQPGHGTGGCRRSGPRRCAGRRRRGNDRRRAQRHRRQRRLSIPSPSDG